MSIGSSLWCSLVLQTYVITSPVGCRRHPWGCLFWLWWWCLFLKILRNNSVKQLLLSKQKTSSKLPSCLPFLALLVFLPAWGMFFEPFSQAQYNACWPINSSSSGVVEQGLKQSQYKVHGISLHMNFVINCCHTGDLKTGLFQPTWCPGSGQWSASLCANDPFRLVSSLSFITVIKVPGQGYLFCQGYNKGLYLVSKSSQVSAGLLHLCNAVDSVTAVAVRSGPLWASVGQWWSYQATAGVLQITRLGQVVELTFLKGICQIKHCSFCMYTRILHAAERYQIKLTLLNHLNPWMFYDVDSLL